MKTLSIATLLFLGINFIPKAQSKPALDSVVINVGTASKITILIRDKKDLETLKQYNMQTLMSDLITKIEAKDTTSMKPASTYVNEPQTTQTVETKTETEENWKKPTESERTYAFSSDDSEKKRKYYRGTRQSVSFDIGTNNYLSNGNFPSTESYTVRPWGSWYVAVNSVHRTRVARTFFLEWGLGLSQYNFKFQNDAVRVAQVNNELSFTDARDEVNADPKTDYIKSKLSATFINASFVPVLDFGGNYRKPVLFDGRRSDSFRIGVGPYAGYRIDSFTRFVYKEDGDKEKRKDRGNYYLNNFRYGLRLQLGFKDTDLFFNYDLNELFAANKGPKLNAFSFGVSF